jgi:ATP/maltotriose-dependent transcriptional regulator MalT
MMGPFASVLAHSWAGIAAKYELDIPTARREFREAFEIGTRVGSRSHAARLAGALLGELLYEAGELDDAARMLEMSYGLGPDGGGVDYLAARYVASAKVKAAQGDLSTAAERLDAGMKTAENLQLPRLAAAINNERIRLGVAPSVAARLRSVRTIPRDDGISTITAELDEESVVRLLLARVRPTSRTRHGGVRPNCLQAWMPGEGRWRRCALNCCWLKFVPAQEDLLIRLSLP